MIADFLSSFLSPMNATIENPRFSLNDPAAYEMLAGGGRSDAGICVNPERAMSLAAVWQAATTISADVSLCTPNVHIRGDDAEIDEKHPAQWIIAYEWNDETPQEEGWERIMLHALLYPGGYAYIERKGRFGAPVAMYNLLPDRTCPVRLPTGELFYTTVVDGKAVPLYKEEVFHLKGPSLCTENGLDLTEKAREAIGLALAAQGFSAKYFANGSQSAGILEIPAGWTEGAAKSLEEGFTKRTSGKDNWFKTVILRDGAKFHSTTIDAQKSQTGELRDEQVREVARFFKMPPSMLGVRDSISYNSQEQARLAYKQQCLAHWLKRIRGQAELKLMSKSERQDKKIYIDHNTTKLVETDAKSMAEILQLERQNEVISANEWRRKINMPARKDGGGDEYINPNTRSAQSQRSEPEGSVESNSVPAEARAVAADAINRMARRVCFDANNAAKKPAELCQWLDSKAQVHRETFQQAVRPSANLIAAMSGGDGESLCFQWEGKFFSSIVSRIEPLTNPPYVASDLAKNVEEQCRQFTATVADELTSAI